MPTGLTYGIYDGTDTSFRSFALKCARGRDEVLPLDKAPVYVVEPYYWENIEQAEKEYMHWLEVKENPEELKRLYEEYCKNCHDKNQEYIQNAAKIRKRYEAMREKVVSWNPGTDYNSLKELMLEQIDDSIKFDCHEEYRPYSEEFEPMEDWIGNRIQSAKEYIEYYWKQYQKAYERVAAHNKWIKGLYESLDEVELYQTNEE